MHKILTKSVENQQSSCLPQKELDRQKVGQQTERGMDDHRQTEGWTTDRANAKVFTCTVNSLPNNKILNLSKLKAFADDKINVSQKLKFGKSRKHCRKRRKCWLPAFSFFPQCFQKLSFLGLLKVGIVR